GRGAGSGAAVAAGGHGSDRQFRRTRRHGTGGGSGAATVAALVAGPGGATAGAADGTDIEHDRIARLQAAAGRFPGRRCDAAIPATAVRGGAARTAVGLCDE